MSYRKLIRLLGARGTGELRARGSQALLAWRERNRLARGSRLPTDAGFLADMVNPAVCPSGSPSAADLLEHFVSPRTARFFEACSTPERTVGELRARWPEDEARCLRRAEDIREGRFRLLGGREYDFGVPTDWQRDPETGRSAPLVHWSRIDCGDPRVVGNIKVTWELNRQQYLVTLGKAYWYTNDERYAQLLVQHMASWMDGNPPKLGVNWASSLEVAFRAISWIWGLHFLRATSSVLTAEFFLRCLKFLHLKGRHIESFLSTYSSPNTHLTGEALGLLYLGAFVPELRHAGRWRTLGWEILRSQLPVQVKQDGVYFEQSTFYQRYTADFYLHAWVVGLMCGLDVGPWHDRVAALFDHLMFLTKPDGRTPLLGDDDGGVMLKVDDRPVSDFRASLATAGLLFSRGDYAQVAGGLAQETLWLLGSEAARSFDLLPRHEPPDCSRAFPDGGYYVMRSGWGPRADYVVVDGAPQGAFSGGHSHAGTLGFELAVEGRTILVDPGTFTYTAVPALRNEFRASTAHNTVIIDGRSSSTPDGVFSWKRFARVGRLRWIDAGRFVFFEGEHDGYRDLASPVVHRRAVLYARGLGWMLRDRIVTSGRHRVDVRFNCAPGIRVELAADRMAVCAEGEEGGVGLDIAVRAAGGSFRIEKGWVSEGLGVRTPAVACLFSTEIDGTEEILSVLTARHPGGDPTRVSEVAAKGGRAIALDRGEERDLLLSSDGELVDGGEVTSDASLTWVRLAADGEPEEAVLFGVGTLRRSGREVLRSEQPTGALWGRRDAGRWMVERIEEMG